MFKTLSALFILITFGPFVNAQSQQWIQYYLEIRQTESIAILPELGYRVESGKTSQYLGRIGLGYDFSPSLNSAIGFTYLGYFDEGIRTIEEYRPHQEVNFTHAALKRLDMEHRIRVEERFRNLLNDGKNEINRFNLRLRYQLTLSYNLFDWSSIQSGRSLILSFGSEVFLSAFKQENNPFDQNRLMVSSTFNFNDRFSIALTYNGQYQRIGNDLDLTPILWLQVAHIIK